MSRTQIDINCDMGESYGRYQIGNDGALMPYISSSNIACGFHGGDPLHIEQTIQLAVAHGVRIGAHPGYPDLAGFGRRRMDIPANELRAIVKYQVAALQSLTKACGGRLLYVKPHGALYNAAASSEMVTDAIMQAVQEIDPALYLMGLAGSLVEEMAAERGIPFIAEAFADRRYEANGQLMSRSKEGAVLHEPAEVVKQVLKLILEQEVLAADGTSVKVQAQSICIHGDNPSAVAILQALDKAFQEHGIEKGMGV